MIFQAHVEFQTPDDVRQRRASSASIVFESDDPPSAAKDVAKWFAERHEAIPDYWHTLCAYKVYVVVPQRIEANGHLRGATGFPCYEWKCDFGWPAGVS